MQIISSAPLLVFVLERMKQQRTSTGFVPTMGALHEGHLSLMQRCRKENDVCVASIFVNPTQFNDPRDLERYPRTPDKDIELLEQEGCDVVFMPAEKEIYPQKDTRIFDLGNFDKVMEGAFRPGHFNGVAQVVTRLFDIVKPQRAYFGEKDFQQLVIIRKIVADFHYPVEIVACPVVREPDGLAMSSRNRLLSEAHRRAAPFIYETLKLSVQMAPEHTPGEIKKWVLSRFEGHPLLQVEYFEIVQETTLEPVTSWQDPGEKRGCIAVKAGEIRLIDNIKYNC